MDNQITVNEWKKAERMDREHIIRFQVLVYCHLAGIGLTDKELECLTYIGMNKQVALRQLCSKMVEKQVYTSSESTRGAIDRLQDKGLLEKAGKNRKTVSIAPTMKLQTAGNILLDIKCLCRE